MKHDSSSKKTAIAIASVLLLLSLASLLFLLRPRDGTAYAADIYQNGMLIESISLSEVQETRTFTIEGDNGCVNEIQVRPGCIAVISADCPDKICVRQGFISDSRLPITCLPNRLVIQLRPLGEPEDDPMAPDAIAY